jgi:hypothetical protein
MAAIPSSPGTPPPVATQPSRCWSWRITKLRGPVKWTYLELYVLGPAAL